MVMKVAMTMLMIVPVPMAVQMRLAARRHAGPR